LARIGCKGTYRLQQIFCPKKTEKVWYWWASHPHEADRHEADRNQRRKADQDGQRSMPNLPNF
jgi:hypothetical protein